MNHKGDKVAGQRLIDFKCPYCAGAVAFQELYSGTVRDCPVCFRTLVVPDYGCAVGRRLPVHIKTPRLILRPLKTEDQPDLVELLTEPSIYEYSECYPVEEEDVRDWFD